MRERVVRERTEHIVDEREMPRGRGMLAAEPSYRRRLGGSLSLRKREKRVELSGPHLNARCSSLGLTCEIESERQSQGVNSS